LSVLLYNSIGFRMMISYLESKANTELEAALDDSLYDDSQLLCIKIPVTYLPYYNNSKQFERVNGQIEIKGIEYKYVKRRIFNDSLEMICIPNQSAMTLKKAENEFLKFVNDLQPEKKSGHHSGNLKNSSTDSYMSHDLPKLCELPFKIINSNSFYATSLRSAHVFRHEQPPEYFLSLA
jgi:hypothetical protein